MKVSSKIGWVLVALSVVLSVWVLAVGRTEALTEQTDYEVDASGNLNIYDSVTSIDGSSFAGRTDIKQTTFPSSIVTVGTGAFQGCTELTSVTLNSGLQTIGDQAFYNTGIGSITIPATVTSIGEGAFDGCDSLTSISVASGNSAYRSSDGALYNAAGTRLIFVPNGKGGSISIADGCTTIGSGAFAGNGITAVTLPSSVTTIETGAFDDSKVSTIYIYNTGASIGSLGSSVSTIYGYAGSTAETYAQDNHITFIVLGNSGGGDDPSPTPDPDPDPTPDPDPEPVTTYTVTFSLDGGNIDGSTADINYTVEEGGHTTVPADPTKSGYVFAGWGANVDGYTVDSDIMQNVTFTAKWVASTTKKDSYTVVFDVNGGAEHYDAQTVSEGAYATNPGTPTRSGYTFVGWYHGGTAWDFNANTVTSDMTLIAWWKNNATGTVSNGTGAATLGAGRSGGSGSGSAGGGHSLDQTPTTADGDLDPRLALCMAIFLAGVGVLIYSRQTKMQFLANRNKR
jgi:uncharacterized repeat protein (TIGR02543 family)